MGSRDQAAGTRGITPWPQDSSLSYTARGILADILSRPADFRVSVAAYEEMSSFEGHARIAGAMRELAASGYLHHVRRRTGAGLTVEVSNPPTAACGDPSCSDCRHFNGRHSREH